MNNEMKYYFFYLEIPKLDIESDGIAMTTKDNMTEVFLDIKEETMQDFLEEELAFENIIIKQFNKL